ncbi:MAG: GAF domain-containing protein, partial [Anaerolineae bacterium]
VNPAFLAMWGYQYPEEIQGRTIQDLVAGDPKGDTILSSVEELGGWIGKLSAVGEDGEPFTVMLSVSLIREPDGTPSGAVGSFVEMTYRERLNRMLFRQSDWLRAAHEIDRGILSGTDLTEIGKTALMTIAQLVPCASSSVTLFNLKEDEAELLAVVPEEDQGDAPRTVSCSLTGFEKTLEVLQGEEVCSFEHADGPPLPAAALSLPEGSQPDAYLIVPLRSGGELLGTLNVAVEDPARLTNLHESIVQQLADSLAVAVQNAQMNATIAGLRNRSEHS